jgi:O-antigen/teichoic acid export membrane protein
VFFIPMVLLLVPKFGIEGAATAWLLSAALRVIAVYCCFPLVLRIPPPWPILKKADLIEVAAKIRYISQAS